MRTKLNHKNELFRAHMLEQVYQIHHYWLHVCKHDGRNISIDEAATEWIERFAAKFTRETLIN